MKNNHNKKVEAAWNGLLLGLPLNTAMHISQMRKSMSLSDCKWIFNGMTNGEDKVNSRIEIASGCDPITYKGDAHLMTIASTGTGKNRSVIMPALFSYPGPVIVIDLKGENYAVTARCRKEMGHHVVALDPFGIMTSNTDGFNPFDIFKLNIQDVDSECLFMAELLSRGNTFTTDPFWDNNALGLISGVIAYMFSDMENQSSSMNRLREILMGGETVYRLAVVLDTLQAKISEMAYEEISAFLNLPENNTRPSVLGTATSYLKPFGAACVRKSLEDSSFSLQDVIDGKLLSIYIIIPPDKLESYGALLRLWIGTLMKVITMRKVIPPMQTLFILDECAQLGSFPFLGTAITLLRGYGLQTWSFWQDLNQIYSNYGKQSPTLINNCAVIQTFGINNANAAKEICKFLNIDLEDFTTLKSNEQLILLNGNRLIKAARMDYLNNNMFIGKWDENPYFRGRGN